MTVIMNLARNFYAQCHNKQCVFLKCLWRNKAFATAAVGKPTATLPATEAPEVKNGMRAWQIDMYDDIHALNCNARVPIPAIRNLSDVIVEVHASSVNPIDVAMTTGYGSATLRLLRTLDRRMLQKPGTEFPLTLGRDLSGIVRDVGMGVKDLKIGDEVFGLVGLHEQGSLADYAVTSSSLITKKPVALNHVEMASLTYAGLTAWSALKCFGGLDPNTTRNQRALILGGSGGVGTIAIQIIKAWGMHVTTTVNGNAIKLVTSLGADTAVDYTQPNWEDQLKDLERFDFILNCAKSLPSTFGLDLLKTWRNAKCINLSSPLLNNVDAYGYPMGLACSVAEFGFDTLKGLRNGRSFRWAYIIPGKTGLQQIANMAASGKIQPVIEEVFPFEEVPRAYKKVKEGHARGKTVIDFKGTIDVV